MDWQLLLLLCFLLQKSVQRVHLNGDIYQSIVNNLGKLLVLSIFLVTTDLYTLLP